MLTFAVFFLYVVGFVRAAYGELIIKMLFIERDYTKRREKTISNEIKRSPTQNPFRLNGKRQPATSNQQKPKERGCSFCHSVDIPSWRSEKMRKNQSFVVCGSKQATAAFFVSDFIWTGAMRINKRIIPFELQPRKCIRNEKVSNKERTREDGERMRQHCMPFLLLLKWEMFQKSECFVCVRVDCWAMEAITTNKQYIILKIQLHIVTQSHGKTRKNRITDKQRDSKSTFSAVTKGNCFVCFKYIIMTVETFEIQKRQQQHQFFNRLQHLKQKLTPSSHPVFKKILSVERF